MPKTPGQIHMYDMVKIDRIVFEIVGGGGLLTLHDPGGGALKAPPPPIFCSHAFNFGSALLCVGDFSQKIV